MRPYASREELYRKIALSKVATSSTAGLSQISSKSIFKLDGLIVGKIFGDIVGASLLFKNIKKREDILRNVSKKDIKKNLEKIYILS